MGTPIPQKSIYSVDYNVNILFDIFLIGNSI